MQTFSPTAVCALCFLKTLSAAAVALKWQPIYFAMTWQPKLVTAFFYIVLVRKYDTCRLTVHGLAATCTHH